VEAILEHSILHFFVGYENHESSKERQTDNIHVVKVSLLSGGVFFIHKFTYPKTQLVLDVSLFVVLGKLIFHPFSEALSTIPDHFKDITGS
jgi:hypothetical protein